MSGKHKCYVTTCSKQVRVTLLMCADHWKLVPRALQREVYAAWGVLQKGESELARVRYLNAIRAARGVVQGLAPGGVDD